MARMPTRATMSPAPTAGSRSATGDTSLGGGCGWPGAPAAPDVVPAVGRPGDDGSTTGVGSADGSDVAPEGSAVGPADGGAVPPDSFEGFGVTAGTTAVVKFAQRYWRVVSPDAWIAAAMSRPT